MLNSSELAEFANNMEVAKKKMPELLRQYPGQFAAFYQGKLVAVNLDKETLIAEVRDKKGGVRAYVVKITELRLRPVIKIPSSRRLV